MTYAFGGPGGTRPVMRTFRVTAIADIPPVLVDQSDQTQAAVLPNGATRQLLAFYQYAWVGVRLARGTGIPGLERELAALAARLARQVSQTTHQPLPGVSFNISRTDVLHTKVQQAIRPQAVALTVFGGMAALAMLVLVGQGLAQLLSRSGPDVAVVRALGGTRAQSALAVSLPGGVAILGGMVLAVAGAVALSPLAPVGAVRQFDPERGVRADGLVSAQARCCWLPPCWPCWRSWPGGPPGSKPAQATARCRPSRWPPRRRDCQPPSWWGAALHWRPDQARRRFRYVRRCSGRRLP